MTTTVVILEGTDVMPKTGGSHMKIGTAGWSTLMVVPSTLVTFLAAALFLSKIITWEGVGYFALVSFALTLVPSFYYWRTLDEPSREAHKFAMFWGMGLALMIVALIGLALMFFGGARDLMQGWVEGWITFSKGKLGDQQGAVGFTFGVMASTFILLIGYLLAWTGWWASQRIGTKAD
jgi:hypothetical protein